MNIAQTNALAKLLIHAAHPTIDAITGEDYTPDELTALHGGGQDRYPYASSLKVVPSGPDGPEMWNIRIEPASLMRTIDLYLDSAGDVWVWSTRRIPPLDCDCECGKPSGFSGGHVYSYKDCPRHGEGIRELECYRRASIRWAIEGRPARWVLKVDQSEPIRDVLAEYREQRARAKRLKNIDVTPFNEPIAERGYQGSA